MVEKKRKILITGADGFIGSNLTARMLNLGYEVYATVYPANNKFKDAKFSNLHVIEVDLIRCMDCVEYFPDDIDIFYHFAWMGVRPEDRDNNDIQAMNIKMALECMKLAKKITAKKIVLPGSTNEYLFYGKPINKNAIPSPSNAYGAAKIAVRFLFENFANKNNILFIYAIVSGIYAADRRDSNVIYYVIDSLLKGQKPVLTSLEQLWDYVYIDDVLDAFVKLGEECRKTGVYAIGHGDNIPLRKYIEIIHEIIDPTLPMGIGEKEFDCEKMPCSCVDLSDIERETSFVPKVSFEEGIKKVINTIKTEYAL